MFGIESSKDVPRVVLNAEHWGSALGEHYPWIYSYEPQRKANGFLWFPTVELIAYQPPLTLLLALARFDLPKERNAQIDIHWNNQVHHVAGSHSIEPLTVTFFDTVDTPLSLILETWRAQVYNPINGAVGWQNVGPGDVPSLGGYKHNGYLIQVPPDGEMSSAKIWQLHGCFPLEIDRGEVDYSSDEPNEIVLTLAIDDVYFIAHGVLPTNLMIYRSKLTAGKTIKIPLV